MSRGRKRKYIESHWLVFAFQGLIGLLFGWFVMFTATGDVSRLIAIVGTTLLALGVIEIFNLLHRKRLQDSWGLSLVFAAVEIMVAVLLLANLQQNMAWPLVILALYTLFRGVMEILIGFKSLTDPTDRFMWIVCGICGAVLGFVILNSGHFVESTTFIKFFGTYMMIYGITNLIYGVHNKNEQREQLEERREKARLRAAERQAEQAADGKPRKAGAKATKRGRLGRKKSN